MSNWKVYLINCSDNTIYTGITSKTVDERIKVHNQGKGSKYTRARRPVELITFSKEMTRSEATRLELRIKKLPKLRKQRFLESYK